MDSEEVNGARELKVRQYIPNFVETGELRREATVKNAVDLHRVWWIASWKDWPPHRFDHFAFNNNVLMAIYDDGAYWWVVGYLSEPVPGLPAWQRQR